MIGLDWADRAACRGKDTELWFPMPAAGIGAMVIMLRRRRARHDDPYAAARAICAECPVRQQCLDHALDLETNRITTDGMWGGLDEAERLDLRRGRPIQRAQPAHGTAAGYKQHRRLGEAACRGCTEANRARQVGVRAS